MVNEKGKLNTIKRTVDTEVKYDDDGILHAIARLTDPFHEIEVALRVRVADLTIVEANAEMIRVPYADHCPNSLLRIGTLAGIQIGPGLHRNVREAVGGDCGCPYLVDLVIQACKLAIVAVGVKQARNSVLIEHDFEKFSAVRRTMGKCAGHTDLPDELLPEWLERESNESQPPLKRY